MAIRQNGILLKSWLRVCRTQLHNFTAEDAKGAKEELNSEFSVVGQFEFFYQLTSVISKGVSEPAFSLGVPSTRGFRVLGWSPAGEQP
jgi:hypothetical protein